LLIVITDPYKGLDYERINTYYFDSEYSTQEVENYNEEQYEKYEEYEEDESNALNEEIDKDFLNIFLKSN
jgi:hypothetical protein